jgi:hypothetical protein
MKLDRHTEALAAFQAAITTSKESYPMMEALTYRELANIVGGGAAAIQAAKDLEEKLKEFDGRLTRAEFDTLSIAPSPNEVLLVEPSANPSLLPDGKHAFLSYQWDVQVQVMEIKKLLNTRHVNCWMDIDGGMKSNIYDSVSVFPLAVPHGVCACLCLCLYFLHLLAYNPNLCSRIIADGRGSARCGVRNLFHDASVPGLCQLQARASICPTIGCADYTGDDATELYRQELAWHLDGRQHLDTDARASIGH